MTQTKSNTIRRKLIPLMMRTALLIGTVVSLFFVPWLLVKAWILPLPNTLQAQLDEAVSHGFEGVIVYVDRAGQAPQYYASGWHNRELKIPAKSDALFKIASISKLYDAAAVTKLIGAGRLSLDKTIADYLPELAGKIENTEKITLRSLIEHRSGIPNFTDAPNFWADPTETYEESLALIAGMPANFEPGERYQYCNTNYLLINKIMDKELGYENYQFKQNTILTPLNLANTYSSLSKVDLESVMSGYHLGYPDDLKTDDHGMHATAEDVGRFLRALTGGALFEAEEQGIYSSVYEYDHGGWVPGYQSFASYHSDIDTVIVQFYSTTDSDLYYWNLSEIINSRMIKILKKQTH